MKKLLLTICLLSFITLSFSQSLTLSNGVSPLPNNGDISLSGGVDPIDCIITVNNITGSNKTVFCKKALIQDVAGSMNYFCWGLCYPPNVYVGSNPVVINANQSNSVDFSGHYDCQGHTGTAIVRYTFWVSGNTNDSVCFNVHYSGCAVGLVEIESLKGLSEPYPNPASDFVSLRYHLSSGINSFVDLIAADGRLLVHKPLPYASVSTSLSVSMLPKGMYYLRLSDNGMLISVKKMLVN